MGALAAFVLKFFGGGVVNRILQSVDQAQLQTTLRDQAKVDLLKTYYETKPSWLRAGGFWTLMLFALPTALWWASLCVYNVLWCAKCMFPQPWSIAGFPAPYDNWGFFIMLASIGGLGIMGRK